jgi:hypothetical protein
VTNPLIKHATDQAEQWADLKAELADVPGIDDQTLFDTLEGEVDLLEVLGAVDTAIIELEIDVEGTDALLKKLSERKASRKRHINTLRNLVLQAMDIAGEKTIKLPGATYTLRNTKPARVVDNEALIPSEYFKQPDPVLDKSKLRAAEGEVPGTHIDNGGISLTLRRK